MSVPGYELTPGDLDALSSLVSVAGGFGATPPTAAGIRAAMTGIYDYSWSGQLTITSPRVRAQLQALLLALPGIPTSYNRTFPSLLVAWMWKEYIATKMDRWVRQTGWADYASAEIAPFSPPAWRTAVSDALHGSDLGGLIFDEVDMVHHVRGPATHWQERMVSHQLALFDPAAWTDFSIARTYLAPFWAAQSADLDGLQGVVSFDGDAAIVLLHLLASLTSSVSPDHRYRAATILNLGVSSSDYPNDTMADQLVYASMLTLADPVGKYTRTNAQTQEWLTKLAAAVPNADPGAVALSQALTRQGKIARSATSYPMMDPYVPSVGFNERYAHALAAIGKVWSTV